MWKIGWTCFLDNKIKFWKLFGRSFLREFLILWIGQVMIVGSRIACTEKNSGWLFQIPQWSRYKFKISKILEANSCNQCKLQNLILLTRKKVPPIFWWFKTIHYKYGTRETATIYDGTEGAALYPRTNRNARCLNHFPYIVTEEH